MAASSVPMMRTSSCYGSDLDIDVDALASMSDYGSEIDVTDIDEDTLLASTLGLLTQRAPRSKEKISVLPSIGFEEGEAEDDDDNAFIVMQRPSLLRMAKGHRRSVQDIDAKQNIQSSKVSGTLEFEYDETSRRAWSVPLEQPQPAARSARTSVPQVSSTPDSSMNISVRKTAEGDQRSPIERFRTKPKKPLSVTDLVSPAWCELQYFYTLSKFGRKPRTKAMRIGSKIHQRLEEEVHTTVPVQVQTKADRFGLRIWNTIFGLRCLRESGLTRELEVWGVLEGQVVNGVIDEVSCECPDADLEERIERTKAQRSSGTLSLPMNQPSVAQAFANSSGSDFNSNAWLGDIDPSRQLYLADVKTRGVRSKPTGASLQPTWMQLMLYRKLLESLSLNTVDAETVLSRYDLRSLEPFTDVFLHEIDAMGPENEAAKFPNLLSLWSLLISETQLTIPPASLSPILRAEFRYSKSGDIIGNDLVVYDADVFEQYLAEKMAWWKGAREAKGVEIEEAFKCRTCDFAEHCTWRQKKVDEAVEKSRLRREAREKSAV